MTRALVYRSTSIALLLAIITATLSACGRTESATTARAAVPGKGSLIAYTILNNGLYVADSKGNQDLRLKPTDANTKIANLSWSPDGQRILYTWRGIDGSGMELNKLCSIVADGSDERCIAQSNQARYFAPSFAPNGASIVYVAIFFSAFDKNGVYLTNPDGSNNRRLIAGATEYTRPIWSPDGLNIAFNLFFAGHLALITTDATGANATSITTSDDVYNFAWSPNNQSIAFHTLEASYVIGAKGGNRHTLPYKPASKDTRLRWSPDGQRITFDSDNGSKGRIKLQNIFVTDPSGSSAVQLTNDKAQNSVLNWSPDGTSLLFISNREGKMRVYILDFAGKSARVLTKNEQVREAVWQP